MSTDFYTRLHAYFQRVANVLAGKAEGASIFPNRPDIGSSRERVYAEMLKQHLPSSCNVLYGGFLFGLSGDESKQTDIIILSDGVSQYNFYNSDGTGKTFASIDGTLAAVSVKSSLTSFHLRDALDNIASLPEKEPLGNRCLPSIKILNYENWPFKVVFAVSGMHMSTTLSALDAYYQQNPHVPLYKRPDLIHVLNQYVIMKVKPEGGETRDGTRLPPNTYYNFEEKTGVFGLCYAFDEIQGRAQAARFIKFSTGDLLNRIPF